jgi:ABC-type transport system involved in multi-copper enzyme maturation permease subunit
VQAFAGVFQGFVLPMVVFFGCVAVFTGLLRREVRERTLHHYFLCPIRRELILIGKYLAGVAVTFAFFATGTLIAYALAFGQQLGPERFAVEALFLNGPGLAHLGAYLGVVLLACAGYGAVLLTFTLFVRNPIVPAFAVFAWEAAGAFLPPALKKLTVFHYLHALCPVPVDQGPFALLAAPPPAWLALLGLLGFIALLLALSTWRMRRMEIEYGDE